jgi:hypothetical protein
VVLGVTEERQATVHVEFVVDVVEMILDRAFADGQLVGNGQIPQPAGNQADNLELAWR